MPTKIEWTDETWSVVTGCTKVSEGCANCYAERLFPKTYPDRDFGHVNWHEDRLDKPLHWRKPRKIFVAQMGDLFHASVPFSFIDAVWDVMFQSPQHTFQVLTKRPERMREYVNMINKVHGKRTDYPNIWLGVTAENQTLANARIPVLLDTPAAVRFVSCEPLLGPIDLNPYIECPCCTHGDTFPSGTLPCLCGELIDWVIVGGESGPKARPMHPKWAMDIRDQCVEAEVPYFFKQYGEWAPVQYVNQHGEPMLNISCGSDGKKMRVMCAYKVDGKGAFHVNMKRLGKKAAGRVLDGRTWDEYPEVKA